MPVKQRTILLQLNELVKKLNAQPPSTFSPYTANPAAPTQYSSNVSNQPLPPTSKR